jgi:hypothetical protein
MRLACLCWCCGLRFGEVDEGYGGRSAVAGAVGLEFLDQVGARGRRSASAVEVRMRALRIRGLVFLPLVVGGREAG